MSTKRLTRAQLEDELAALKTQHAAELEKLKDSLASTRMLHDAARQGGEDLRTKLDDTKERLAKAEADNQRMRGYIARVQEDDVVREELVKIGDPQGPEQLMPKRKPTIFTEPNQYSTPLAVGGNGGTYRQYAELDERQRARHWVTY